MGQESKNKVNTAFLFMSIDMMLWGLYDLSIWSHQSMETAVIILRLFSFLWMSIGFLFLNFTYQFLNRKRDWIYWTSLVSFIVGYIISVTTELISIGLEDMVWGRQLIHGPGFLPVVFTVMTIPMLYSCYLFYKRRKTTESQNEKKQIQLILVGTLISYTLGVVLDTVIPFGLGYREMVQMGASIGLVHTVCIFIAITRFRFMRIGVQEAASDLFSNIKDGIVMMSNSGAIVHINEAALEILEIPYEEDGSVDVSKFQVAKYIDNYNRNVVFKDLSITFNGMQKKYLSLSQSRLRENDEIVGTLLIVRDVTQAKLSELEIRIKNDKITQSINYAHKIQKALLPHSDSVREIFKENFTLFLPRDIVSGDFYWNFQNDKYSYVCVADCTGHGVPGAFMSIVGNNLLNKIVHQLEITEPGKILDQLSNELYTTLNAGSNKEISDGMDLSLCAFDFKNKLCHISAAHSSIYHVHKKKLIEYEGDYMHIGDILETSLTAYNQQTVPFEPGDCFYLFSDGYADQKGGPKNKKFFYSQFRNYLEEISTSPMDIQHNLIHEKLLDWKGSNRQLDDICVIGLRM